jgi:hypothetical protein
MPLRGMTNDQAPMTKQIPRTKYQCPKRGIEFRWSHSDIWILCLFGHWSLVLGHSRAAERREFV